MRIAIVAAFAALTVSLGGCSGSLPDFSAQSSQGEGSGNGHPTPGYCYAEGQMYDVNAQTCIPRPPPSADVTNGAPTPVNPQGEPTPVGAGPPPAAPMSEPGPQPAPVPLQPQPPAQQ
jgi:hypothetical protein